MTKKVDHFAEFRRSPTEIAGNTGNRVTTSEKPKETKSFSSSGSVTQNLEPRVTRATQTSAQVFPESAVTTDGDVQGEREIDCIAAADGVTLLADAIAYASRSPFLDDLALAKVARFAVTISRLPNDLKARLEDARALCAETSRAAANYIRQRDYHSAYELLDELPAKLRALRPQ